MGWNMIAQVLKTTSEIVQHLTTDLNKLRDERDALIVEREALIAEAHRLMEQKEALQLDLEDTSHRLNNLSVDRDALRRSTTAEIDALRQSRVPRSQLEDLKNAIRSRIKLSETTMDEASSRLVQAELRFVEGGVTRILEAPIEVPIES